MIPAPKQRWMFADGSERWIAEVLKAAKGQVTIKILWTSPGSQKPVGRIYDSTGLEEIFAGNSDPYWTYMEGQDAP